MHLKPLTPLLKRIILAVVICCAFNHGSYGQITGTDTVCPAHIYTFDVIIPGADSIHWTYPAGWYEMGGQGTTQIVLYCNDNIGQVCATGYDTSGSVISQYCKPVFWGGGGIGWDVQAMQIGPCPNHPWVLNVVPNGTGNCGGCGTGIVSSGLCFGVYDNPWPFGLHIGFADGLSPFTGGVSGITLYVYQIDTIFGWGNPILVSGGACPAVINNTIFLPGSPINGVPLNQSPNPVCLGDTVTIFESLGMWTAYSWGNWSGVTVIGNVNDPTIQVIVNSQNAYMNVTLSDILGCYYTGSIMINTITCFAGCEAAWYPFNGNALDSTVNNLDATVNGAQLAPDKLGTPDAAYHFDGVNDKIALPHTFDFPERTWAMWFSADTSYSTPSDLFDADNNALLYGKTQAFLRNDSLFMVCGDAVNTVSMKINLYQWYHIAIVRSTVAITYYLNGCPVMSFSNLSNVHSSNGALYTWLGCGRTGNSNYFAGTLDDVRIYQCALNDSSIAALAGTSCAQAAPVVSFISSDTTFCDKTNVDFTDLSTNSPTSWMWLFPGASPDTSYLQNPTGIYYQAQGTFDVTLVACNIFGCDTLVIPGFITEHAPAALPLVTFSNDTLYSSVASTYQWYLGASPIPGATGQYYVTLQAGSYFVVISDSNGCVATSSIFVITGVQQFPYTINAFITTSPDEILVHVDQPVAIAAPVSVTLYDYTGRAAAPPYEIGDAGKTVYRISTSSLSGGLYLVRLRSGNFQKVFRFVR